MSGWRRRADGRGASVTRRAPGVARWAWAARTRWASSSAFVSGPTPPGTGVIADATWRGRLEVDVADEPVVDDVDPDVDDDRAAAEHRPR